CPPPPSILWAIPCGRPAPCPRPPARPRPPLQTTCLLLRTTFPPPPSMVEAMACPRPAPCPCPPPCPLPALSTPPNRTMYFIRQHYQNMRGHPAQPKATTSTSTHPPNPYPI